MNIRFYHAKILILKKEKEFSILEGELWIKGNKIVYIGDGSDTKRIYEDMDIPYIRWDREIDAKGNVLMPGFKNAHTHTAMTFLRSYADDLPLQEWLQKKVFPMEAKLTHEDIYELCRLGILEYLTSGITTGFDMYIDPVAIAKASKDCGFRMMQTSGLNDFTQSLEAVEEQFYQINEMSDLTGFVLGFHAEYTTGKKLLEGVANLAQKLKSPVWLHNAETKKEVEECKNRYGKTPTELTDALGMYAYGGGGYHCIYFEDKDFEIYKNKGLTAVTCPASNLKLASGIAFVHHFLQDGISMAIGTDGAASNNCLDMFREMFLVSGLAKVQGKDASLVSAEEVLYMATTGGARAMGLDACDSLAEGKLADLIMVDLQQPNMQPENNFVKNIVYSGSKQNVLLTMIDGKILYEKQKFDIGIDPKEVYEKANAIIRRMTK
ncbi:MAG: amidohydrolase [Lachnospiraceae bacterium]|nr:amidohydrolase [Lachnospiraceae bacterium]